MALHTSTILARNPATIISHLMRLQSTYKEQSLFFCLSANAPDLQNLVSRLTSFSAQTTGCLSAPLGEIHEELISCSLAVFERAGATQFRSTLAGRAAPQVGRWHAFRERGGVAPQQPLEVEDFGEEGMDWDTVWDRSAKKTMLPPELQKLSPDDVNSVLFLSDGAPEGLTNALSSFPHATKLGLLASSTPFITGRPVTLFHNGDVHSSGAVGLALTGPGTRKQTSSVDFPGLHAITPTLTVTRSEGNLVNTIDDSNPSRLLLAAIQKHGIQSVASFKDAEFYLGAFRGDQLSQVYRITSGDPSRGTIALESHAAPIAGTRVQLYHRAEVPTFSAIPGKYASSKSSTSRRLGFLASSADMPPTPLDPVVDAGATKDVTLLPAFLGASENGFILSRSWDKQTAQETAEVAWKGTVSGGLGGLEWL